jgi:hypothetical protein
MRELPISAAAVVICAALVCVPASTAAQAQYNPGGYSGSLANPGPASRITVTPAPPPPAARPFFYTPPGYQGGGYYDYRRYGPPNTRDALDTCAYC